jgi:hypothetical protein
MGMQAGATTMEKKWWLLKILSIDLPYDPAIHSCVMYLKQCNKSYSRGTCKPIFIPVLFTIAKLWKQPRCTDEWINQNALLMNGSRKCGISKQWNFAQP